jgi:DNA (cytosine-5)-methyltransferase 1
MGFPESFKIDTNLGESYKQIGNSVCVPMVEAIAQEIRQQNLCCGEKETGFLCISLV